MIQTILGLLFGGGTGGIAGALERAYGERLKAQTDDAKLQADMQIKRMEQALAFAQIAAADRWGATSIGRYLIVIPYGLWWAAIFLDSIISASWNVLAIPPEINAMAKVLIPAIIIGDVGGKVVRAVAARR